MVGVAAMLGLMTGAIVGCLTAMHADKSRIPGDTRLLVPTIFALTALGMLLEEGLYFSLPWLILALLIIPASGRLFENTRLFLLIAASLTLLYMSLFPRLHPLGLLVALAGIIGAAAGQRRTIPSRT